MKKKKKNKKKPIQIGLAGIEALRVLSADAKTFKEEIEEKANSFDTIEEVDSYLTAEKYKYLKHVHDVPELQYASGTTGIPGETGLDKWIDILRKEMHFKFSLQKEEPFVNFLKGNRKLAYGLREAFKGSEGTELALMYLILEEKELVRVLNKQMEKFVNAMNAYFGTKGSRWGFVKPLKKFQEMKKAAAPQGKVDATKLESTYMHKDYKKTKEKIEAILGCN